MKTAIIGGGASGLTAAIAAAGNGNSVTVFEKNDRVGRKILSTGNGRCNLTNINAGVSDYYGENPRFVTGAVNRFWVRETLDFFAELGLWHKVEENGRVYPYSDQASAVLDVLRAGAENAGVNFKTGTEVRSAEKRGGKFTLKTYGGESFTADALIVASGGKAAPNLGSNGSGYDILKSFGHRITPVRPSLVQIKTETEVVKKLKGIKIQGTVTLGEFSQSGEILFTDYGLSGPPIFSLSAHYNGQEFIYTDLTPEYSEAQLTAALTQRARHAAKTPLESFLVGILNKRVSQALLKSLKIEPLSRSAGSLSEAEIKRIAAAMKSWKFKTEGTLSWNNAQVTKGGADTTEFNPNTMESRLVKGLYAAGEVLDIDGGCGGYNLQWAWSSGMLAGKNIK